MKEACKNDNIKVEFKGYSDYENIFFRDTKPIKSLKLPQDIRFKTHF